MPITPSTDPDKRVSRIRLLPQVITLMRRRGLRMIRASGRQSAVDQAPPPVPKRVGVLAAPLKGAMSEPTDLERKRTQRRNVRGHTVVADVSTHDRAQPPADFLDGIMISGYTRVELGHAGLSLAPIRDSGMIKSFLCSCPSLASSHSHSPSLTIWTRS